MIDGRLTAGVLAALLATGCLSPGGAPPETAERLLAASTRLGRAVYEARWVVTAGEAAQAPLAEEDLRAARAEFAAALDAAGLPPAPAQATLAEALEAARPVLAAHDVVLLPASPRAAAGEPDPALARVVAREAGLALEVDGAVVRYRRVEHEAPLLPDAATWTALRAGRPAPAPLGRAAAPTVFLDRDAIARRAGGGPWAGLDQDALAREVELRLVAYLRCASDPPARGPDPGATDAERAAAEARTLVRLHARVLLIAAAEGDPRAALAEARALAAGAPLDCAAPAPEVAAAARLVLGQLGVSGDGAAPADLSERARRALAAMR